MTVRASDHITLVTLSTPTAVTMYYLLQASNLAAPPKPTTNPPPSPWTLTESGYTAGSTNTLYTVMMTAWGTVSFEYGAVQKSSSYEAAKQAYNLALNAQDAANAAQVDAQAKIDALRLRGNDAITNGNAALGLLNFPGFSLDTTDHPVGAHGSFYRDATQNWIGILAERISIDPSKLYLASISAKEATPGVTSRFYYGLLPYDVDGLSIQTINYMEQTGTRTTLTTALKPGDTKIYLSSAANWKNAAGASNHLRNIVFWNYVDGTGKLWGPGEYSRNTISNAYADGGIAGNVITLSSPYAGPLIPAGTAVSNGSSGGTYMYAQGIVNQLLNNEWKSFVSTAPYGGIHDTPAREATTKFPIATSSVSVVLLVNRGATGGSSKQLLANVSLSESAAAIAAAAIDAQNKADAVRAVANAAQTTANGKNRSVRSPNPASGSGVAGDEWWQYGGPGNIQLIGYWLHNGSTWMPHKLDGAVLDYVDAHSIKTGTLDTDRLGAKSIATEKLLISDLTNLVQNPYLENDGLGWNRLTGGISVSTYGGLPGNAWTLASDPSWSIVTVGSNTFEVQPTQEYLVEFRYYSDSYYSGYVQLYWMDKDGNELRYSHWEEELWWSVWTSRSMSVSAPLGAYYGQLRFRLEYSAQGMLLVGDPSVRRKTGGSLIVDGTIETKALEVMSSDHAEGVPAVRLSGEGVKLYDPEGTEVVSLTANGGQYLTLRDGAGDSVATIDDTGGASFTSLGVSGEARIDGSLVVGGDPIASNHGSGEYGPVINGRDLLGATFTNHVEDHPNITDASAWMTVIPHGMVLNTMREDPAVDWDGIGSAPHSRIRLGGSFEAISGRLYQISYSTPAVTSQNVVSGALGESKIVRSAPGGSISLGSAAVVGSGLYYPNIGGWQSGSKTFLVRCPEDIPAGVIMLGIEMYVNANRKMVATGTASAAVWTLSVLDMGIRRSAYNGNILNMTKQGTAAPTPPPPPPPPVKKQYATTWNASWGQAYRGGNDQAGPSFNGSMAQGRSPYSTSNGVMRGLVGFPSVTGTLSGADMVKVEVYLYASHWHANAGGTACIGGHTHATKPTTWSSNLNNAIRQKLKKPEGRWITLPSSMHAGFKSGTYKGISLLPPSSSTSTEYYGKFDWAKSKLRITYKK